MIGSSVTVKEVAEALSVSIRFVNRRSKKEGWPAEVLNMRGDKRFLIKDLPGDVQAALVRAGEVSVEMMPMLAPEAALAIAKREMDVPSLYKGIANPVPKDTWADGNGFGMSVIRDPKVGRWTGIIQEAQGVPSGWKKSKWMEAVAIKHSTTVSTIYRKISKYETAGLAGLHHTKSTRKQPKTWSPEALDWWVGLVIKKEHRKIAKDVLYVILKEESRRQNWRIGGYRSALWWIQERVTPQLRALQRGGVRALDNTLPPVLRDYSDLAPFEILVGDQHRFDFWVVDEESGEVFRPEGFFWQDLRTRCFYGGALDRKYDSYLVGLAMRMGIKIFGAFDTIYTDNGKPELSRYVMGIMADIRSLGLNVEKEIDVNNSDEASDEDGELVNPCVVMPGTHRKAIVRNAKAKMIEGTFNNLEGILRDHFLVPGYVKRLGALPEENEVDEKEIKSLAQAGKLLGFWEFASTLFKAMDYYNSEKAHRGVLKEWKRPKPKSATPMDCLKRCYMDGWRPGPISDEAADLIFMPRASRAVDRGRITYLKEIYEHDVLTTLENGTRVEIRFDPLDPEYLLVFHNEEYLCRAEPVEYSSMKDQDLASRKIEEKRRTRKGFILEYRKFTAAVPDFREYSKTPAIEKAAALVGKEKREKSAELEEQCRVRTPEELEAEVAGLEARGAKSRSEQSRRSKPRPKRPAYFLTDLDRYRWMVEYETAGGDLDGADAEFRADYEAAMSEGQREYWDTVRELAQ